MIDEGLNEKFYISKFRILLFEATNNEINNFLL